MENKWLIITSDSPAYEATDTQLKQLIDHIIRGNVSIDELTIRPL